MRAPLFFALTHCENKGDDDEERVDKSQMRDMVADREMSAVELDA